jgi:hypothetical protein
MEEVKELEGGPVLQEKKQPSKRAKWIKRIFLGLLALVTLLFSGLVIAVTVYEDEIVTYALQTVQGNLKTKSSIREADLTLWNNFPSVSIRFKDVYVEEEERIYQNDLIYLKELENEILASYPVSKQGLLYIQEEVDQKAKELIDAKNDGLKRYKEYELGFDYPTILDMYNNVYSNNWLIPVILDKHKIYSIDFILSAVPNLKLYLL